MCMHVRARVSTQLGDELEAALPPAVLRVEHALLLSMTLTSGPHCPSAPQPWTCSVGHTVPLATWSPQPSSVPSLELPQASWPWLTSASCFRG